MRFLLNTLSLFSLAAQRLWNHRLLMFCLLIGLVAAVGLLSSIPLYSDAAQNKLLHGELTEAGAYRPPFSFLWRYIGAWNGAITWEQYGPVNKYLTQQAPTLIDLDLESGIRHVSTEKLRLFPTGDVAFAPNEPLLWANVGFITGLADHIRILEGEYPASQTGEGVVEVLVSHTTADTLGLQVDENYVLLSVSQAGAQIPIRITGIWQAIDDTDSFWFYPPDSFDEMFLTAEGAFEEQVIPVLDTPVDTAVWYQFFDGQRVRPATVNDLIDNVAAVQARVSVLLNNTNLEVSPVSALERYGESSSLLTLVLTVFSLPVTGLVVYFISLISGMVVQRGQSEIANMRSRGITRWQILNIFMLEGLLVCGIGLVLGLELGRWMAGLMSQTRTFLDPSILTGNPTDSLTIIFTSTAYGYALVGVVLTLVALLAPALASSKHSIVTLRWEQARTLMAPAWQRYYLDIGLLIPPLYGWYQLSKQGSLALGSGNDPFSNPLLFLVPVLFCFSLGLFLIRFFPLLMRLLAWLASWLPGATLLLMLRQLARSTTQYLGPLLLLSLTVSLATFTASMALTLDEHLEDQIYYQVGADLNIAELGESTEESEELTLPGQETTEEETDEETAQWLFLPVTDHLEIDGVTAAARVGDYDATANIGGRQQTGAILGIDRIDFPNVAYFRPDFAYNETLGALMNRLALTTEGILVSDDFLVQRGLEIGDPLDLTVGTSGVFADVSFTIVGAIDLFPSLYPQDGPFFVANLDHIHTALGGTYPYDVWLSTVPAAGSETIVQGVRDLGIVVVSSQDARQIIANEQTQPERQGLFGLLSVGFIASAVLTVIGFLVYAVVSFRRRFIELGMLRAIGLSVTQMAAYLTGELAVLIATGVAVGTCLGVWASTIFIPFFQVGDDKTAFVPPFVVQIAWNQVMTIYLVFGVMFIIAVIVLAVLLIRMKIFEAVKLGEAI
ncbi:MAG: ABC transporter permease [Anaerolineales bacterium]|nr:ABC transporter permease [Anaerolineales bacterium]